MPTTRLFGYTIEEADGKLVITVDGAYAARISEQLQDEVEGGRGWKVLSSISPMFGLSRMERRGMYQKTADEGGAGDTPDKGGAVNLDLGTIFKQGFADPYETFASRLEGYKSTMADMKATPVFKSETGARVGRQRPVVKKKRTRVSK